jgi:hypothetical protein
MGPVGLAAGLGSVAGTGLLFGLATGLTYIPGMEGPTYRMFKAISLMDCAIYKALNIAFKWVEKIGEDFVFWMQVGFEDKIAVGLITAGLEIGSGFTTAGLGIASGFTTAGLGIASGFTTAGLTIGSGFTTAGSTIGSGFTTAGSTIGSGIESGASKMDPTGW